MGLIPVHMYLHTHDGGDGFLCECGMAPTFTRCLFVQVFVLKPALLTRGESVSYLTWFLARLEINNQRLTECAWCYIMRSAFCVWFHWTLSRAQRVWIILIRQMSKLEGCSDLFKVLQQVISFIQSEFETRATQPCKPELSPLIKSREPPRNHIRAWRHY